MADGLPVEKEDPAEDDGALIAFKETADEASRSIGGKQLLTLQCPNQGPRKSHDAQATAIQWQTAVTAWPP
jgi:hypothetical protein